MASKYHWLTIGGGNGAFNAAAYFASNNVAVPNGATIKRVLIENNAWRGRAVTTTEPPPDALSINQTLQLSGGIYGTRIIYDTSHLFTYTGFGVYNVNALRTTYSAVYGAGDVEIGINHPCEYGGPGKNVGTFTYSWFLNSGGGAVPSGITGNWQYSAKLLYYL